MNVFDKVLDKFYVKDAYTVMVEVRLGKKTINKVKITVEAHSSKHAKKIAQKEVAGMLRFWSTKVKKTKIKKRIQNENSTSLFTLGRGLLSWLLKGARTLFGNKGV